MNIMAERKKCISQRVKNDKGLRKNYGCISVNTVWYRDTGECI